MSKISTDFHDVNASDKNGQIAALGSKVKELTQGEINTFFPGEDRPESFSVYEKGVMVLSPHNDKIVIFNSGAYKETHPTESPDYSLSNAYLKSYDDSGAYKPMTATYDKKFLDKLAKNLEDMHESIAPNSPSESFIQKLQHKIGL